jgi:hypothetical protein
MTPLATAALSAQSELCSPPDAPQVALATRVVREMRGCCKPFLLDTNDGLHVVKFRQNPVHYRVLVNDFIASFLMRALGMSSPETTLIWTSQEFLIQNPIKLSAGSRSWHPSVGLHFGSRHPGENVSVHDILPGPLCGSVRNRDHFYGAAVFDSWISNADFRQAIFLRTEDRQCFRAEMIDHSEAFDGPLWTFTDRAIPRLLRIHELYDPMTIDTLEPWIHRIATLPESVIWGAALSIPDEWLQEDGDELYRLLEKLAQRQRRIGEIVQLWFRNWSSRVKTVPVRPPAPAHTSSGSAAVSADRTK